MELAWSPAAVDDLEAAVDYIESELASPMAARRLVDSVIGKAQLLADISGAGALEHSNAKLRDIDLLLEGRRLKSFPATKT